ncbi:hypothetical protein [Streptomyces chattanoogensis]|uniref:hypothetical protein n=1 Tax=Streptomyces chattanoogensis TaxID=66876 RepID=UPI00368A579E
MAQLDTRSEGLTRTEAVAEMADIYRSALALLRLYDWAPGNEPSPDDALRLATFLALGEGE